MKVACRQSHLLQRLPILRKVLWGLWRSARNSWRAASRSPASSLRFPLPEVLLGFLPSELLGRPRLGHRRGDLRLHRLAFSSPTPQGRLELSTDRRSTPQEASAPLQCSPGGASLRDLLETESAPLVPHVCELGDRTC